MKATEQHLIDEARRLLASEGYRLIDPPFLVGDVLLDLEGILEGPAETLSLVMVASAPANREERHRLYWSVQRLARALDAAGSLRSVTVVLSASSQVTAEFVSEVQSLARVLTFDEKLPMRRYLAPLLRLELSASESESHNGLERLETYVRGKRSGKELLTLIAAARDGAPAVRDRLRVWMDDSFAAGKKER